MSDILTMTPAAAAKAIRKMDAHDAADAIRLIIADRQATNDNDIEGYVSGDPSYVYTGSAPTYGAPNRAGVLGAKRGGGKCCQCDRIAPEGATMVVQQIRIVDPSVVRYGAGVSCVSHWAIADLPSDLTENTRRAKPRKLGGPDHKPLSDRWNAQLAKAFESPGFSAEWYTGGPVSDAASWATAIAGVTA